MELLKKLVTNSDISEVTLFQNYLMIYGVTKRKKELPQNIKTNDTIGCWKSENKQL